jgi:hypothetical protein
MKNIEFTGRKPSKAQINAKLKPLLKAGETFIQIQWGENQITLERFGTNGHWVGSGWIKGLSGYDLGQELNNQLKAKQAFDNAFNDPVKFMREHFTIVHIS